MSVQVHIDNYIFPQKNFTCTSSFTPIDYLSFFRVLQTFTHSHSISYNCSLHFPQPPNKLRLHSTPTNTILIPSTSTRPLLTHPLWSAHSQANAVNSTIYFYSRLIKELNFIFPGRWTFRGAALILVAGTGNGSGDGDGVVVVVVMEMV